MVQLERGPGSSSRAGLQCQSIGGALLVHPEGKINPQVRAFVGGLAEDPEHTLVVVDLPEGPSAEDWESVADLLKRRGRSFRVITGRPSRETAETVGQLLADRLERTVLTPDGWVLPGPGGVLFVPEAAGSGWLGFQPRRSSAWARFAPHKARTPVSRRFPVPDWDRAVPGRSFATSADATAEPVPAGIWIRRADQPENEREVHRRRLAASLHCQSDRLTVVLGCPGTPDLSVMDIERFWGCVAPDAWPLVRFAPYGPVGVPEGSTLGQLLADRFGQEITFYAGLPTAGAPDEDGPPTGAPGADGTPGPPAFLRELVYRPAGVTGSVAPPPVLRGRRSPADGLPEVSAGVYRYASDAGVPGPGAGAAEPARVPLAGEARPVAGPPGPAPEPVVGESGPTAAVPVPDPATGRPGTAGEPLEPGATGPGSASASGPAGSAAAESAPAGPAVAASVPVGSAAPGSVSVDPAGLGSVPVGPAAPGSAPAGPAVAASVPVGSAAPGSAPADPAAPVTRQTQPSPPAPAPIRPRALRLESAPPPGAAPAEPAEAEAGAGAGADTVDPESAADPTPQVPQPAPAPVPAPPRAAAPTPTVAPAPDPLGTPAPVPASTPPARPKAQRSAVRVQSVPSAEACAVPPERGIEQERTWLRRTLKEQYDSAANHVARVLSESPGLRGGSKQSADEVVADLVAVRLYLSGGTDRIDGAVRSATVGPHVPLARCVASGLRRLPSYRGATLLRTTLSEAEWHWYGKRRLVTEWAFCSALTTAHAELTGDVDVLIWSMTARRTALLDPTVPDRVLYLPGTSFKVLGVRDEERRVLLLRELTGPEIGADGSVDVRRLPLDDIAVAGLEQAGREWQDAKPAVRLPPAAAGALRNPPGLIVTGRRAAPRGADTAPPRKGTTP